MATSITQTANPAGVSASANVATYSSQSIGPAAPNRIVVVAVASEQASTPIDSCTIDYGSGDTAMTAGSAGNFGAVYARLFYLPVPTGTTATIKVTWGTNSPTSTRNHIAVYSVVGGTYSSAGNDGSTDMDATDPLTTGSITIASGGGFIAVAGGATDTAGKTWANATEDIDADAGALRFTTATRTTALTTTAVTCRGTTNGEDGALSYIIFTENASPTVALNSPADAASTGDLTPTLNFTGTDSESDDVRYQVQVSPVNFTDITIDTAGGDNDSSVSSITSSITVASGNNRKLIVTVANNYTGTGVPPSGVTYNGDPLTMIESLSHPSTANNVSIWELSAPDTGTHDLVVTAAVSFDFVDVGWVVYQNASQNPSVGDSMEVWDTQNPTLWIPCPLPGSHAVSMAYPTDNPAGGTITGATEFQGGYFPDAGYSGPSNGDSGPITHQYSGSAGTEDWIVCWVAVLPAYADGLVQAISGYDTDLSDNFNDNSLAAKWGTYTANGGSVSETSSQLHLTCANSTNGSWAGIYSNDQIDFREMYAQMEVVDGVGGNTYLDMTLCADVIPNTEEFFVAIGIDTGLGNLQAYKKFGGTEDTIMASLSFNPTNHKYLRMRETAGVLYWEYSADNSTWTELHHENTPAPLSRVRLVVDDYEYNGSGTPGAHIIDNLVYGAWQSSAFSGSPDSTDPFASAQAVDYTVQSDLTASTTYYWRVRAIDPAGSNTYGDWSSTRSFTATAGGGTSYTPTYTETMTLVDTISRATSRNLSEAVTYVDTVLKNPARILTDVTILVDTIVRAPGKLQSEVMTLVDTYSRVWITSRIFEETTTLVDTVPKSTSRTLSDQASLIDTIVFSTGKVITEALALVDTITKSISRTITDASTLVDTLEKNAGRLLSEAITLVDSLIRSVGRFLLEVVTMVDSIIKSISRTLSEVLSLVDVLVRGIFRYLSDFLSMVDTFISELISTSYSAILTETITLVDNIEKLFNHIVSGIPTTLRHLAQIRPFGFLKDRKPAGTLDDIKPEGSSGRGIESGISLKDKNKPSMM